MPDILLKENQDVKELSQIFINEKMGSQFKDFADILDYVGKLENQLDKITEQLSNVTETLAIMKENPFKAAFKATVENIDNLLSETKLHLDNVKQAIINGAKQAVQAFKQKGISVLNGTLGLLHIKESLQTVQNALNHAEKSLNKAVRGLEQIEQKAQKPSIINDLKVKQEKIDLKPFTPIKTKEQENML